MNGRIQCPGLLHPTLGTVRTPEKYNLLILGQWLPHSLSLSLPVAAANLNLIQTVWGVWGLKYLEPSQNIGRILEPG